MLHRATPYFSKGPGAIANDGFAKRSRTHALSECVHDHGLFRSANLYYLGPKTVDVLLQCLSLILFHIKQVVRNWRQGPVR